MKQLLQADLYRMVKSKLTMVLLILSAAFPLFTVLIYAGLRAISSIGEEIMDSVGLLTANTVIGSAYSLTNNIGLVIPVMAGILVCTDFTSGTLRNKVVAGNPRTKIYFSHLIVSILYSVVMITIYVLFTAGFALLMLPYKSGFAVNVVREYVFWAVTGTMSFVFMATVSTFFAMTFRSIAPTILLTLLVTFTLLILSSTLSFTDYSNVRHLVYFIPTFSGQFFSLTGGSLIGTAINALVGGVSESKEVIFAEGIGSFVFFGAVNTVLGVILFCKRDLK